jgi:hypothetical protein
LGNVWIDAACVQRLGGVKASGDWNTLNATAPAFDAIANPCTSGQLASSAGIGAQASSGNGFVFSRTDTQEYRWIASDSSGQLGNIWIDAACVQRMGGVKASGDWQELNRVAPGFDTIASPCY